MSPFKHLDDRKERKTSRTFAAPTKDQATTGRFMVAGDYHGVGFRTPVGKFTARPIEMGPIPMKCSCSNPDEIA